MEELDGGAVAEAGAAGDVAVGDAPSEDPAAVAVLDPAMATAVLDLLGPILAEAMAAAVAKAAEATPVPVRRPGTCVGLSPTDGTASVICEPEPLATGTPVVAQVVGDWPAVGQRVVVSFEPGGAVFVDGLIGGGGVPWGTVIPYVGTINAERTTVGNVSTLRLAPWGYLRAYGQVVEQADHPGGYSVLGTAFNTGGEAVATQYRLPDLRGRALFGLDNLGGTDAGRLSMTNTLGGVGGAETHTLAETNLPSHTHGLNSHTHSFTPAGTISGSVSSHTHDLANHTHTVNSHTHDLGSHTHTVNSHTHDLSNHTHSHTGWANGATGFAAGTDWFGDSQTVTSGGPSTNNSGSASPGTSGPSTNTSGGASPGTGTPSTNTSGSASPSIAATFTGTGGTTGAATGTTAPTGSGTAVNHLPPYMLVNWLIRV